LRINFYRTTGRRER